MQLHPSWWRAILADPTLIPVPLDHRGLPDLQAHEIPGNSPGDPWLLIAPGSARLCPDFVELLHRHARERPDVGIFYADEAEETGNGSNFLQLKPAMNLFLLVADDYVGMPVMVRLAVFKRLNGFRDDARSAIVYDLLLRASQAGICIERIAVVMLAHEARRPRPSLEDRRAALVRWLGTRDESFEIAAGLTDSTLQLRRRFRTFPHVTLIVPTCQALQRLVRDQTFEKPHITNFLDSILLTDWPMDHIKVLIGDDIADQSIYAGKAYPFEVRHVDTQRPAGVPFNYSAKMNRLWRLAETEYLVLMNDDIVIRSSGWLRALMTFAMEEDVGGVGARLLFGDGRIQHAGMPGGLFGSCAHAWIFAGPQDHTYNDWAVVHREWSMVTGAVFSTRRSVLASVNGFDEQYSLEYNDVELCLRMQLLGLKVVYTPFAELTHFEKASRGNEVPRGDQVGMFLKRWDELLNNDPAFNPGFDMQNVYLNPMHSPNAWYTQPLV